MSAPFKFEEPASIEEARSRMADLEGKKKEISIQLQDSTRRDSYASEKAYYRWVTAAALARARAKREITMLRAWIGAANKVAKEQRNAEHEARVAEIASKKNKPRGRSAEASSDPEREARRAAHAANVERGRANRLRRQREHQARLAAVAISVQISDIEDPFQIIQAAKPILRQLALRSDEPVSPEDREKALSISAVMEEYLTRQAVKQLE